MCSNEQVNTDLTIWAGILQGQTYEGMTDFKKPGLSCENERRKKALQDNCVS